MALSSRRYNRAREISRLGRRTFIDCLETLERYVDVNRFTAQQVADLLDAMYASGRYGYEQALDELGIGARKHEDTQACEHVSE